jgi:hypothetical protein
MIKILLIVVILLVAIAVISTSSGPRMEIVNETAKITAPEGNASFEAQNLSWSRDVPTPEIRLTSYVEYAECRHSVLSGFYRIQRPEYYVFDNYVSGNDCLCPPNMMRHSNWSSPMFGQLVQPYKNLLGSFTDKCQVTFCYSSGMVDLGRAYLVNWTPVKSFRVPFVLSVGGVLQSGAFDQDHTEIKLDDGSVIKLTGGYDCDAPRMYALNGAVKSSKSADALFDGIYYANTSFKYRIENRDQIVKNLEQFLASSVPGCSVSGRDVVCRKQFKPEIEAYVELG